MHAEVVVAWDLVAVECNGFHNSAQGDLENWVQMLWDVFPIGHMVESVDKWHLELVMMLHIEVEDTVSVPGHRCPVRIEREHSGVYIDLHRQHFSGLSDMGLGNMNSWSPMICDLI